MSPSILFLDEPTSGMRLPHPRLYELHNFDLRFGCLQRCGKSCCWEYNRTVVFTIHQPRSNIVALFDQLVLLAQGKLVYSGEYAKCQEHFTAIGQPCPPGFNIADFLSTLPS
jgi:ABC-type multidrug transport system ATPase subunit